MGLHLVDGGNRLVREDEVNDPVSEEVADAYRPDAALALELLHGPPASVIVAVGHVDEVEVEVVRAEVLQRLLERRHGPLVARVLDPHLRRDEDVGTVDAALRDCRAHRPLVSVARRGVNEAVSEFERREHALPADLLVGYLEDPEPKERHLDAVVERDRVHGFILLSLLGHSELRQASREKRHDPVERNLVDVVVEVDVVGIRHDDHLLGL